jgi:hypothetical protein
MMGTMTTTARTTLRSSTQPDRDTSTAEQLTLLPTTQTPARFRLSQDTRERGLRHVAEIRKMLAARTDDVSDFSPRHDRAA